MKVKIGYMTYVEKVVEVPKKWEFYFKKDEDDYTNKEWDLLESNTFLGIDGEEIDVLEIVED